LIDTCVFIDLERGRLQLPGICSATEGNDEVLISVVTVSELLFGVHSASHEKSKSARSKFVEYILKEFPAIPIDANVARVHSKLWAELSRGGTVIGSHDLWIAATCLAYNHKFLTRDKKSFGKVKGLVLL
jgi:predicted nucleic acid-binding protein